MPTNYITLSRQELYDRVWSEPMTSLAKNFGISDVPLAKRRTTGETAQPSWPGGRYARFGSFCTAFNRKSAQRVFSIHCMATACCARPE